MDKYLRPIRPQVSLALLVLGGIAVALFHYEPANTSHLLAGIIGGITGITGTLLATERDDKGG